MNADLCISPLCQADLEKVSGISVATRQVRYSGTVAEAFETAEDDVDLHGIFKNRKAVGFFRIDRAYAQAYPFAATSELGLRAFMIDHRLQGRGMGARAMYALPGNLRDYYPDATGVVLTVN